MEARAFNTAGLTQLGPRRVWSPGDVFGAHSLWTGEFDRIWFEDRRFRLLHGGPSESRGCDYEAEPPRSQEEAAEDKRQKADPTSTD